MKYENYSFKENFYFTEENFLAGTGLELSSNQTIKHEIYDTIDITGAFTLIDSKSKNVITVFSLFESSEKPTAQALIDINIDKNKKLKPEIIIKSKSFNEKFEYLEKYYNLFINIHKKYIISNLKMALDLSFNKENVEIDNINMNFLVEAELGNKKYILNVEKKCKEFLIKYNLEHIFEMSTLEDLTKVIKVLQYADE